jgi:hypothetical protein
MSYKSILTVVTSPAQAEAAISAAAQMALGFDAHLEVLALGVDQAQLGYSYIGSGAILTEFSLERAEADARASAEAAQKVLAEIDPSLRYSVETVVAEMGSLTAVVGNAASFVDLVVQGRPYGGGQSYQAEAVIEAAMFEGSVGQDEPACTDGQAQARASGVEPKHRGFGRRQTRAALAEAGRTGRRDRR